MKIIVVKLICTCNDSHSRRVYHSYSYNHRDIELWKLSHVVKRIHEICLQNMPCWNETKQMILRSLVLFFPLYFKYKMLFSLAFSLSSSSSLAHSATPPHPQLCCVSWSVPLYTASTRTHILSTGLSDVQVTTSAWDIEYKYEHRANTMATLRMHVHNSELSKDNVSQQEM